MTTRPPETPSHVHPALGWLLAAALAGVLVASGLGIVSMVLLASHNSVDKDVVQALVDEQLAAFTPPEATATPSATIPAPTTDPISIPVQTEFGSVLPTLTPKAELSPAPADEVNVSYAPNVPPAADRTNQAIVTVEFDIVEKVAAIDPATGIEFETWGYQVRGDDQLTGTPGPMVRARVGDVLRFVIYNPEENLSAHNVDFHAVTGQGGGAENTLVAPGESAVIEARMLYPGMFMYHCAAGDVPGHIAHGMYGGILVDPETPLPQPDKEFYIVQSEYYLTAADSGPYTQDREAMTDEHPTMVVFNGAKGALTGDNALQMDVGDRARFYFVNAGLNLDSNFHPIGSHWDSVWPEGASLNQPIRGSQTTLVPAGGGVIVDLLGQVPSNIILVDHALTRAFDKGAIGIVTVSGEPNPEIFEVGSTEGATASTDTPAAVPEGTVVTIVDGAWTGQPLDAPDEFADDEVPVDYDINVLTVQVGTTVTWVNEDSQAHTVTDVDLGFDSGLMSKGDTWSYTFTEVGEFEYFCAPHPWMRAKVIVEG